jgi:glycosyltransferase involved in cell wall biosynthesis
MKVLHVITSLTTGGAEKLILDGTPVYEKQGIMIDVLSLCNKTTPFRIALQKTIEGNIFGLTKRSVYNPFLIIRIIPFLKKYDVIHVHLFPALYWVVIAKLIARSKTPVIYTEHNTHNKRRDFRAFRLIERFIYSKLSFIGCISDGTLSNLDKHLGKNRVSKKVINNGIHIDSFSRHNQKKIHYGFFHRGDIVLIQVSSFGKQKDQQTLIKAMSQLPEQVKLLLVGDGILKATCENLCEHLKLRDRVIFLGNRYDIPGLVNFADIVVQSSNWEGFGLTVVEGMAARKPVIASNVEGIREIVEGYGLLFKKNDSYDLAEKVKSLIQNQVLYSQVAASCYQRAKEYDIEVMVKKYIIVYNELTRHS